MTGSISGIEVDPEKLMETLESIKNALRTFEQVNTLISEGAEVSVYRGEVVIEREHMFGVGTDYEKDFKVLVGEVGFEILESESWEAGPVPEGWRDKVRIVPLTPFAVIHYYEIGYIGDRDFNKHQLIILLAKR